MIFRDNESGKHHRSNWFLTNTLRHNHERKYKSSIDFTSAVVKHASKNFVAGPVGFLFESRFIHVLQVE